MKKLMIVLMLVLVVSIIGCGQPATTADTTTGAVDAPADTTADTVDDIEQEIAAIDELESDLDLSELDSLAADLEI